MAEHNGPFSANAVAANQCGHLTGEQSRYWNAIATRRRQSVRGVAYVFAAMSALLLLLNSPPATAAKRTTGGIAFLALTTVLLVAAILEPVNADVRAGRVASVEGAISKRSMATRPPGSRLLYFDVGGRRLRVGRWIPPAGS